ncbi:hypothetical protein [Halosegnis longus]|uniref:hypothetical protein n=1 Tax=Halosegnis longus TaxID=2216012 RepID=UPI00129D268B|nr:hypothetical protein [Halosegnis longus]
MMRSMVSKLVDSEAGEHALGIFAEMEIEILQATFDLADAAGVDRPDNIPPKEGRKQALQAVVSAVVSGDFAEFWAEEMGAELFESTPSPKHVAAGADSDVWESQIETWAAGVREQHDGIEATDRELAGIVCNDLYGAELAEYENRVVAVEQSDLMEQLVAGNMRTAKQLITDATAEIQEEDNGE